MNPDCVLTLSGLSSFHFSFWIEHSERNLDSESFKFRSRFISGMELGMKWTLNMAKIKTVYKMRNFIHVFKCIRGKIAEKIR